jgi:uncharacterized membrane protein YsdA (DUF1294 family)
MNAILRAGTVYAVGINLGSYGLFYYDKQQALNRGWRVPEKQLQLSALLGGWVGGLMAMKQFKHKTVKQEFRIPYFACMGANIALIGVGGFLLQKNPKYRKMLQQYIRF